MVKKVGSKKNFGWGRKTGYAGAMALNRYLSKKPASRAAHKSRWNKFCKYLKEIGINDVRKINKNVILTYSEILIVNINNNTMKHSYAINILSTINVVLSLIRQDKKIRISPATLVGRRTRIRLKTPKGMDDNSVICAMKELSDEGLIFLALSLGLMRFFGLRRREACLFDAVAALNQAQQLAQIRIFNGTKGGYGRKMERCVPILSSAQIDLLSYAAKFQGQRKDLRPENFTLKQSVDWLNNQWKDKRHQWNLGVFHDLRSCYACARYQAITNFQAPVLTAGKMIAEDVDDLQARKIISKELGHLRIDILGAYIGGRTR